MHRQITSAAGAVFLALFLAGCGLFYDPVKDLERQLGVPVQTKTVEVGAGMLTFYRYVKGRECGDGLYYDFHKVGGDDRGVRPCAGLPPLTQRTTSGAAGDENSRPFVVIYGEINDRRITRVMVEIQGQSELVEAQVTDGRWYVFLDGYETFLDVPHLVGLDAAGKELFSESGDQEE